MLKLVTVACIRPRREGSPRNYETSQASIHPRHILWLTVGALTLLIGLLVTQEVYGQWRQLQRIEWLKGAVIFSDKLFDATGKLSTERDVAFAMLHAPAGRDADDLRARLQGSRNESDAAFADTLSSMNQYDFSELGELRAKIETHLAAIKVLRQDIDAAMQQPDKTQKTALAARWYDEVTGLSSEVETLWIKFIKHFTDINPIVTQHLRYAHFLRIITDYTGRQRALIRPAFGGKYRSRTAGNRRNCCAGRASIELELENGASLGRPIRPRQLRSGLI